MSKSIWLRYSLASLIAASAAVSGLLVACSSDDETNNGTITPDSGGGNDTGPGNDTDGGTDSGSDGYTPPKPVPAKLLLVHGALSLGPTSTTNIVRVCFATAPKSTPDQFSVTPFPVLPHTVTAGSTQPVPGIPQGTGGPFPASGANYEDLAIKPYVMNADRLAARGIIGNDAATPRCNQIFGNDFDAGATPWEANKDFWELPPIPAGALKADHTYMLVLTGCTLDTADTKIGCGKNDDGSAFVGKGAANPGVGNLKLSVVELDTSAVANDEIGAQFIHASAAWDTLEGLGHLPTLTPVIGTSDPADAGAQYLAGETGVEFKRDAIAASTLVKLKGVKATDLLAAHPDHPEGKGLYIPFPLNTAGMTATSLPSIQVMSTGSTDTAPYFVNGKSYTFIAVGDPQHTEKDLQAFHFLGFPNVFTPPALQ